jgi:hypothetical protein
MPSGRNVIVTRPAYEAARTLEKTLRDLGVSSRIQMP